MILKGWQPCRIPYNTQSNFKVTKPGHNHGEGLEQTAPPRSGRYGLSVNNSYWYSSSLVHLGSRELSTPHKFPYPKSLSPINELFDVILNSDNSMESAQHMRSTDPLKLGPASVAICPTLHARPYLRCEIYEHHHGTHQFGKLKNCPKIGVAMSLVFSHPLCFMKNNPSKKHYKGIIFSSLPNTTSLNLCLSSSNGNCTLRLWWLFTRAVIFLTL